MTCLNIDLLFSHWESRYGNDLSLLVIVFFQVQPADELILFCRLLIIHFFLITDLRDKKTVLKLSGVSI